MLNSKNLLTPNILGNIFESNSKTKVKDVKKSFWFKWKNLKLSVFHTFSYTDNWLF